MPEINTRTSIVVNTTFIGFHRWKDAPDHVAFLRDYHRHVFHIKVVKDVKHDNRDIEFITFKKQVDDYLDAQWSDIQFEDSCEQIAKAILTHFSATSVYVSEDNENGAVVFVREPESQYRSFVVPVIHRDFTIDAKQEEDLKKQMEEFQHGLKRFGAMKGLQVSAVVRKKCFVGTEAEGPFKGTYPVLFVPGCVTAEELRKVWNGWPGSPMKERIKRIYCGAGNLPYPLQSTVSVACELVGHLNVDVEVDRFERVKEVAAMFPFTVISHAQEDKRKVDFIKTVDSAEVNWWRTSGFHPPITTKLDDGRYAQDVELDY